MCEAVKVEPKQRWRPQDTGDASDVVCLQRVAAGTEEIMTRMAMWVENKETAEAELSKPVGAHITPPQPQMIHLELHDLTFACCILPLNAP